MADVRKILVPVDFSPCSEAALAQAVELSERYFGAAVDVLHVWELPRTLVGDNLTIVSGGTHRSLEEHARIQVMKEMEEFLAGVESRKSVQIRRLHEPGDPVRTILEVARKGDYDLIVLGTHGRTGMAHDYLGSIAEKVVRRAPCPVLTFRQKTSALVGADPPVKPAAK